MKLEVLPHSHKSLHTPTLPVKNPPPDALIQEMLKLMHSRRGVGLSANQVGINQSFFVMLMNGTPMVCMNPSILRHGRELIEMPEGCLSIFDEKHRIIYKPKLRWAVLDAEFDTIGGGRVGVTLKRWNARIFQHEMDHLEGKLCQDIEE